MAIERPLLEVIGIYSDGTATLFDGLPAIAGAHLRWSFRRELGFPRHGFTILSQRQSTTEWNELAHVTLPIYRPAYYPAAGRPFPDETAEAMRRIIDGFDERSGEATTLRNRYEPGLAGPRETSSPSAPPLIQALDDLLDHPGSLPTCQRLAPVPAGDQPRKTRLRLLDMLFLAGLDPYLARALGLYYIDKTGRPGFKYRLIGHWGSEAWPQLRVNLRGLSPSLLQNNELAIDDVRIFSPGGVLRIDQAGEDASYLNITAETASPPIPILRIVFPYAVVAVDVHFLTDPGAIAPSAVVDGRPATITTEIGHIQVQAADARSTFTRLDLTVNVPGLPVSGITYQEKGGPIGDIKTDVAGFTIGLPGPVTIPMITHLRQAETPLLLDAQGHAPAGQSQVELACIAMTSTPDAIRRPVRLHIGRSIPPGAATRAAPDRVLTRVNPADPGQGPAVYNHHALCAAWSMAPAPGSPDRLANKQRTGSSPVVWGGTAFTPEIPEDANTRYFNFDGSTYVEITDLPDLLQLGDRLTLQLRLNPRPGMAVSTLIGNDWERSFWLGLLRHDANHYRARLWLKGEAGAIGAIHSSAAPARLIQADRWNTLAVIYDGQRVVFYVNGVEDAAHLAVLGPVRPNPAGVLRLGDDISATDARPAYPYRGQMADVRIWREALAPEEAEIKFTQFSMPPVQFIDRGLPDGDYAYQAQGIDLFGRVSAWSAPQRIAVRDKTPPSPPVNVHGEYLPFMGRIIGTPEHIIECQEIPGANREYELRKWLIRTNIQFPRDQLANLAASVDHGGYDLTISHPRAGAPTRVDSQSFEILEASLDAANRLTVTVREPPFAQLAPATRDPVYIAFDHNLRVSWGWTGLQRLFHADTREFRIYTQPGPVNTLVGRVNAVTPIETGACRIETTIEFSSPDAVGALIGIPCQVGQHRYRITRHTLGSSIEVDLSYEARPAISPRLGEVIKISLPKPLRQDFTQSRTWEHRYDESILAVNASPTIEEPAAQLLQYVSPTVLNHLRKGDEGRGIAPLAPWLPEPYRNKTGRIISRVYSVTLDDHPTPAQATTSFVPGVLVGLDVAARPRALWKLFQVLWHRRQRGRLVLYVPLDPGADTAEPPPEVRLAMMTYYPGQQYAVRIDAPPPPGILRTAELLIGISASDGQRETADPRGDAERYGNESAMSPPVTVVAVNRQRPLEPPRPNVRIDRADYYGKSRAEIWWDPPPSPWWDLSPPPGVTYQVYRAVDAAVFTRDLLQRRLRLGHYRGVTPETFMLADDPDWEDWLRACAPVHADTWARSLFPAVTGAEDPAYRAVNGIWREWFERFYPALTNDELRELAMRNGNEGAFNLVNTVPIQGTSYTDTVSGLVHNRYLYRLQSQSPALLESTVWGVVSDGVAPIRVKPPRTPVFTRVQPGDRSITLDWALNREPDLKGYRLYRAERAEDLEDLRWFGEGDDPRLIKDVDELPDPRLKTVDRTVTLPPDLDVAELLGVYRADQFDVRREPSDQPQALNYLHGDSRWDSRSRSFSVLRKIGDGISVIIVYRSSTGDVNIYPPPSLGVSVVDNGLSGRTDYYYRITAVSHHNPFQGASSVLRARCLENSAPPAPTLELMRSTIDRFNDNVHITVSAPLGTEILVERRGMGALLWATVHASRPMSSAIIDDIVPAGEYFEYRARAKSHANFVSMPSEAIPTWPIRE